MILLGLVNIEASYKCHVHDMSKLNHACRNCSLKKASLFLQKLITTTNKLCFS